MGSCRLLFLLASLLCCDVSLGQQPPTGNLAIVEEVPLCSAHARASQTPQLTAQSARQIAPRISKEDRELRAQHQFPAPATGAAPFQSLVGPPCTPAAFALLSGQPLVDALAVASDSCLGALWSFNPDVAQVISSTHVELVATQITADAASLAANADRLRRLSYFYQIAFFHEFYEGSVSYSAPTFQAAQQALATIGAALDLTPPSVSSLDLIEQWATSVDSTNATISVLPQFESVLARYNGDPALASSYQERLIVYRVLFSLARQIGNNCQQGASSPWYSAMPATLLTQLSTIALNTAYSSDEEYLVDNALWTVSRCACLDAATSAQAHSIVSTAYLTHTQYSLPWLRAVTDLENQFGSQLSDGTPIDIDMIRDQVKVIALPNEFTFDQGRLVFETAISQSLATEMYEAIQEVESQFFRKGSQLTPVAGDENEVLTLVIYGSPDDYDTFQPFLYGLSTNNGGIFIEGWGTLFTYDRTPQQSIYTLEELLRHEYVHYLASRYLIRGGFNESGTLYQGNRLVWFDEGLAEYLAGSSRVNGVLPRGILLDQIDNDASRLSISDIVGTGYGSFTFYRYAGMLFHFLETQRPDLLVNLFATVRGDDIALLDALYATMEGDAQLQADYDQHLTTWINTWNGVGGTFSEDVPTTPTPVGLATGNDTAIRQALDAQHTGSNAAFQVWPDRFRYSYDATTPTAGEPFDVVREQLDSALDATLTLLTPQQLNFTSTVAWCGELTVDATSATATYVFEGPYLPDPADTTPPPAPTGLAATASAGVASLTWDASPVNDLAGYQVYRSVTSGGPYTLGTPLPLWENYHDDEDAGTGTWYYVVTALDASGNESGYSLEVMVETIIDVLVVNGYFDNNQGYYNAVRDTLNTLGIVHDAFNPFVDGAVTASLLAGYKVVIWPCGYFHSGFPDQLGAARRQLLSNYLDAGGSLVLSGAYVSNNLQTTPFFDSYIYVDHLQWGMDLPTLIGEATHPFAAGVQLQMRGTAGYRSEISLTPPAQPAFHYDPASGPTPLLGSGVAASTVDDGYRVLFLAFPFADLATQAREQLLASALPWLNPPPPCPTPFIRGDVNGDGAVNVADSVYLLAYLFSGGPPAVVEAAADVNSDGNVDISDPIFLLGYLFGGGAAPAAPFPTPACP